MRRPPGSSSRRNLRRGVQAVPHPRDVALDPRRSQARRRGTGARRGRVFYVARGRGRPAAHGRGRHRHRPAVRHARDDAGAGSSSLTTAGGAGRGRVGRERTRRTSQKAPSGGVAVQREEEHALSGRVRDMALRSGGRVRVRLSPNRRGPRYRRRQGAVRGHDHRGAPRAPSIGGHGPRPGHDDQAGARRPGGGEFNRRPQRVVHAGVTRKKPKPKNQNTRRRRRNSGTIPTRAARARSLATDESIRRHSGGRSTGCAPRR